MVRERCLQENRRERHVGRLAGTGLQTRDILRIGTAAMYYDVRFRMAEQISSDAFSCMKCFASDSRCTSHSAK